VREKENINEVFGEDLLQQLVQLLGNVPRIIILLISRRMTSLEVWMRLWGQTPAMRPMLILAK